MAERTLGALEELAVSQLIKPCYIADEYRYGFTPKGEVVAMVLHFLMVKVGLPNKEAWALTRTYVNPLWQDVETLLESRAQHATTTEATHG